MKITVLFFAVLFSCSVGQAVPLKDGIMDKNFIQVTDVISFEAFEQIKKFILEKGDKMTYRNYDGHNPHYRFLNCDVYLGADIGQKNIDNDPTVSDFNQLTIADRTADRTYYVLVIVRKGDLKANKAWIQKGMAEEQVYLVAHPGQGLERLKTTLPNYLQQIKKEMSASRN